MKTTIITLGALAAMAAITASAAASSSSGGHVALWNTNTEPPTSFDTIRPARGGVGLVSFSPDGSRLLTDGDDKVLKLWDVVTRRQLMTLHFASPNRGDAAFFPDGDGIVADGETGLHVWRTPPLSEIEATPSERSAE